MNIVRLYPALCLPVIWASVLAYGWEQLRLIALHELPSYLLQTHVHSVLGSEVVFAQPGSAQYIIASAILGLVSVAIYSANACCFFVALMMTARMLQRYTTGESSVRLIYPKLVGLSILFVIATLLISTIIAILVASLLEHLHRTNLLNGATALGAELLSLSLVLAYLFTSPSMRFLGREYRTQITASTMGQAKVCSAIAAALLTILTVCATQIHLSDYPTFLERVLTGLFLNVADALPYIPLFVAMSLLEMEAAIGLVPESAPMLEVRPTP